MISLPFNVICDGCQEANHNATCLIEPLLLKVPKTNDGSSTIKRFLVFEYPEELKAKGWMTIDVNSILKTYCPSCKEMLANQTLNDAE